ncbi:MAG TPA: thiamine phosphate synthase [Stellaceae bacterium]|jgi:thiamine-phosphate pyrophosphorylase|nr:thiamine phosphate synthase [Stellaceae bacterium]
MHLPNPPLLIISDRSQAKRPLIDIAAAAFRGGCRWFSLREKDLPAAERRELLAALVTLGRGCGAIITVHDDLDAAVAVGAGGVHLPGGGNPAAARQRLPNGLIGVSAHSPEEAAAQIKGGADYASLSPIFLTASKPGYGPAIGLDALGEAAHRSPRAIVALGGIDDGNIASCLAAGAGGIAVMGEIMRAADPEAATRALLAAIEGKG